MKLFGWLKRKPDPTADEARLVAEDAYHLALTSDRGVRELDRQTRLAVDDIHTRLKALEDSPDTKKLETEIHQLGVLIFEATNMARRFLKERVQQ